MSVLSSSKIDEYKLAYCRLEKACEKKKKKWKQLKIKEKTM